LFIFRGRNDGIELSSKAASDRLLLKKRRDEKVKASMHTRDSLPLKRERLFSVLILFLLAIIAFFPFILGKNLVPFGRYPQWSFTLAKSSGQELRLASPVIKRQEVMPWAEEPEVSSIVVYWVDDLYFAHMLKRGKLPLWDPYTGGGVPTLDNGQSRPFNPFRLPFYFFPTTWVYSLTLLAGLVFGGIGTYVWLLRQGLSPTAVALGTGLFVLNPWVLDRLVQTDSAAYFVLPWCLLTLEQAVWGAWPSIGRAVLCFVLMGHSGHPEPSLVMAGVAASFYIFGKKKQEKGPGELVGRVKTIGVVAGLTLACLTLLWLPPLRFLFMGDIYKKHGIFIFPHDWRSLVALPSNMFVAPTIFAVLSCAIFAWRKVPKVWMALFGAIVLVLFPLPWIGLGLPTLITSAGLPSIYLRWVFWASLSFLVAFGFDAYLILRKGAVVVASVIGGAMLILTGWQFVSVPMARTDISAFPAIAFLLLAMGLFALMAFRSTQKRLVYVVLPAIILAPLAFPMSLNKLCWNTIDFKTNSVVEWLRTNRPSSRSASVDPDLFFAIPPNLGKAYDVRCIEIIAAMFPNNYYSMFRHSGALASAIYFDVLSVNTFSQMGASVVLLPNEVPSSGLDLLSKGSHFSAYSIPGVHGRLYFAERASHYKPEMAFLSQILSLSGETDAVAVVEGMGNPLPEVIPEVTSAKGKAVFEKDETEEVLVRTESPLEGLLVLRDSWYPGWMAFVDGKRCPILRVNGCFRGVTVSPGKHRIRFEYRPILVYASGAISLLAVLLVMFVSLWKGPTSRIGLTLGPRK
jgi:hypothetical protein